ncbi:MAG: LysM peptidoglycan-binding domain-containing protein, partial [Muribaculaceae bacterium]|nr:LysM peptidoglycan-binding domain-containing protein [Muribaculaceae bacterium]
MKVFRTFTIALMALAALTAAADSIHVAKKGESIGGIAYQYNISVDELLRLNPHASNGVRPGMKITIPDQKGSTYSAEVPEEPEAPDYPDNPDNQDNSRLIPINQENPDYSDLPDFSDYPDYSDYPDAAPFELSDGARTNILVMLPLTEQHGRQAENYVDFYRGMILAANSAKDAGGLQVGIHTYDIPADTATLVELAHRAIDNDVAAIVVPNNDYHIEFISSIAADSGAYVANFFSVKDSTYASNPYVLQTYINQPLMYAAAIDYLLTEYAGYTPVILNSGKGKKEKEPFINSLRERYERFGLNVLEVKYDETLTSRSLNSLPEGGKYVFIPMSGSREVFNNFAEAVSEYIVAHPLDAALFGYPDWTSFNGEAADMLHTLGAEIYTRI